MSNIGKVLYELQETDLSIRHSTKRIEEIQHALADHHAVKQAERRVRDAEDTLKPLQTELRDLELQIDTIRQKRESSEKRLYSGTVSNPKELQDIEQNIAALARRQTELEDQQLDLMVQIESAQEKLEQASQALTDTMAQVEEANVHLKEEKGQLETEIETLEAERLQLTNVLDPDYLQQYHDMQPAKAFRPIAVLSPEGHCSVCGVRQTSVHLSEIRQNDDLLRCNSCDRFLIVL